VFLGRLRDDFQVVELRLNMSEYTQGSGHTSVLLLTVGRHLDMSQIRVAIGRNLIIIDLYSVPNHSSGQHSS
jgi:hypothetical protein